MFYFLAINSKHQKVNKLSRMGDRNLHYFNIKMWLTIKYWTILVPKTQLNTINFYLTVIEIFVNYYIKVILSEYDNFCIIPHLLVGGRRQA